MLAPVFVQQILQRQQRQEAEGRATMQKLDLRERLRHKARSKVVEKVLEEVDSEGVLNQEAVMKEVSTMTLTDAIGEWHVAASDLAKILIDLMKEERDRSKSSRQKQFLRTTILSSRTGI